MIAALILAGGQARRLGGADKALLALGGRSLLARLIQALTPQVACIALSANGDPARFAAFNIPVLGDGVLGDGGHAGAGPLAGLLAGLDWAAGQGATALLSVPCDTPFIPADLVATLAQAPSCAASLGRVHYLVALWPVAARSALRMALAQPGRRDVAGFAAMLGMRAVAFPAPAWDPFLNINTHDDLALAEDILGKRGLGERERGK